MKTLSLIVILLGASSFTFAAPSTDICDLVDIPNCRGITKQLRRNTFQTAPNTSSAANLNPANVSYDRGFGVEALAQAKNPLLFSVVSGTGRMGGALISGSLDNSFFGNRTPELPENFLERNKEDRQFKNQKLSLALGGKLISQRNVGLDVGVILKRHSELKNINPGLGMSGRFFFFHFGASIYQDEFFVDLTKTIEPVSGTPYSIVLGKDHLEEKFQVTTYTFGTRIKNLSLDMASIRSKLKFYDDPTEITIFSAGFHFKDFLLNAALRKETSNSPLFEDGTLKDEKEKSGNFFALQYSINRNIIFGINYNYFLLKEMSLSATFFI